MKIQDPIGRPGRTWDSFQAGWQAAIAQDRQSRGEPVAYRLVSKGSGKPVSSDFWVNGSPPSEALEFFDAQYAYATPQPAEPVKESGVPDHLIERLRKHCEDKANTAFSRSTMREALHYLITPPADDQAQQEAHKNGN